MFKKAILSAVLAVSVFGLTACDQSGAGGNLSQSESTQYKEGKHYTVLNNPLESVADNEVLEFFWYGCPHCYAAEKTVKPFFALNKEYTLTQQHSQISNSWMFDAYVFYGLKGLGRDVDLGPEFFQARQDGKFSKSEDLVDWLKAHQITSEQFDEAATSPEILALRAHNSKVEKDIGSKGVPAFIVEGKYKVEIGGLSSIGGWDGLPNLLKFLMDKDAVEADEAVPVEEAK